MLDCNCKLATGKLQEPRRHAPEKQPTDATRMSIPRMYDICTWYLVFAMYVYVCLEACDYTELSLPLG